MANIRYVRKNRIAREMKDEAAGKGKRALLIGGAFALAFTLWLPQLFPLWLIFLAAIYVAARYGSRDEIRASGAAGEDYSLGILKRLPDSFVIFNQLEVPDQRSRTGFREIDFVVCGPTGIFVVESKNHNGAVSGHEKDERWTVHKVGRGGTPYSGSIRNPVRQVRRQVHVLSDYLKGKGIGDWVTGAVALSGDNGLDGITSTTPVVRGTDLAEFILSHAGRPARNRDKVVAVLAGLRENGI